jgi:hypothetical protein
MGHRAKYQIGFKKTLEFMSVKEDVNGCIIDLIYYNFI